MKFKMLVMLLSCMFLGGGCALQRDLVALNERLLSIEDRIRDLEQRDAASNKEIKSRIETYSKTQQEKEQELRTQSAGLQATFDRFREEIQNLRGRLEETEFLLKRKADSSEASAKNNEKRLEKLEKYLRTPERPAPETRIPSRQPPESDMPWKTAESDEGPPPDASTPSDGQFEGFSQDELYNSAKQAFDQGDFEKARQGFKKLLEKYPTSKWSDNAQFWLGEIYYKGKWYEKAILEYQTVIEKYPDGNKVKAALLKQGFAFFNLGDKANARLILQELIDRYPESHEADIAEQKLGSF
ncbi:tol-pal system protein YbgF [Desulfococcaceae bacterium HSG8]|nr:tol-pal system protein YbgF [Desulfococcaceae bacterium HSG8]